MTPIASLSCTPSGPVRTEGAAADTLWETARVFGHRQDEEIAERRGLVADGPASHCPIDLHHGCCGFTRERVERGTTAMAGWSFGCPDDAGAICRVVTFEGLVPGQPDGRS